MISAGRVALARVAVVRMVAVAARRCPTTRGVGLITANRGWVAPLAMPTSRHFSSPPILLDQHEVLERILTVVKNFDQVDPSKVTPDVKFAEDLGLDSLDIVEVVMAIEDEFAIEIPDQEADKIASIKDAVDYISTHPMAK